MALSGLRNIGTSLQLRTNLNVTSTSEPLSCKNRQKNESPPTHRLITPLFIGTSSSGSSINANRVDFERANCGLGPEAFPFFPETLFISNLIEYSPKV